MIRLTTVGEEPLVLGCCESEPETFSKALREYENMETLGQITLTSVTKQFGDTRAVDNVSLQIEGGEFFSLLGPSGCGKTTTLRIIGGFVYPTSGEVFINGEPMQQTPPYRRPVNTVFQNYALFPHKTVAQNIAFGLQMKKMPKAKTAAEVERFLALIRLPGYGARKPSELSGGEKQRVALARALINQPTILLLDEPLAALDLQLRKQMQLELKTLQRQVGITFVYVTHDQGEALALSDRIAVMRNGKLLQVGTPAEIYDAPRNRFVANFIGTSNFFQGRLSRCEITPESVARGPVPREATSKTAPQPVARGPVSREATSKTAPQPVARGPVPRDASTTRTEFATVELATEPPIKIIGRLNSNVQDGESVTVAIRPERIELTSPVGGTSMPDTLSCLNGIIQDESYLGTTLQYTVQTDYPTPIIVHQQNTGAGETYRFRRGDKVSLTWRAENAIVLSE